MLNKTVKFLKNNTTAIAIIMLLLLSSTAELTSLPSTRALASNSPLVSTFFEYSYVSVGSNVVGKGQPILLVLWTADIPPDIGETDGLIAAPLHRAAWTGQQFNVTDPDGNSTIITLGESDPVGGGYATYVPTKTGTYSVVSLFPDTVKRSAIVTLPNGTQTLGPHELGYNVNPSLSVAQDQHFFAAKSNPATFICQEDPVPLWTESPLPSDYWTRPISNAARQWSALPGNWLNGAWNQPAGQAGGTTTRFVYGVGTETSHILWTRPQYVGGYADARFGDEGYMTGHYQGLEFDSIILNGRIFYADRADAYTQEASATGFNVIDLYTGNLIEYENKTMPNLGQIYMYNSPNQHGAYSFLWRTSGVTLPPGYTSAAQQQPVGGGFFFAGPPSPNWEMLDGYTLPLRHICYIGNVTAVGTQVIGNNGEILYYNIVNKGTTNNPSYYLSCWNNTNVAGLTATPPGTGTSYWQWRPEGGGFGGGPAYSNSLVFDGSTAWSFNVSIPNIDGPKNAIVNQTGTIQCVRVGTDNAPGTGFSDNVGGYVIVGTGGSNNELGVVQGQLWALSLDRGQEGKQLWTSTFTPPFVSLAQNETVGTFLSVGLIGVFPEQGVIIFHSTKKLTYWGYDMKTGTQLWQSAAEPDENYYSTQYNYYNGLFITSGYGGVVIAYNITTGQQVWNFTATNIGGESPYGNYPIDVFAICDNKLYTLTGEHSVTNPLWRGPNIRCVSATDGTEIWNLLGMGADNGAHLTGQYVQMGDGKVVGLNYMDNQIYCIGPGPSATTVSTPDLVPTLGSTVMIKGTVTDQTPTGRRNDNYQFDFTLQGTPAISDASMGRWMEYMFENQIMPSNATGVPVTLTAIDPNGNIIPIGTVTSDIHGKYGTQFTPEVPGQYQIIATFAGSKAYGPSSDSTYMAVREASATPTPVSTETPSSAADMYFVPVAAGLFVLIIIVLILLVVLLLRKRA